MDRAFGMGGKEPRRTKYAEIVTPLRFSWGVQKDQIFRSGLCAPQVGLEPTTLRLTAECSAIELLRNIASVIITARSFFRNGNYMLLQINTLIKLLKALKFFNFCGLIDEGAFLL